MSESEREWTVLIVEDDAHVASLHRLIVDATPGFSTIATAVNAAEGYAAVARLGPDLAIVDISMPGEDGVSLLRRIRQEGHGTEAIVVTAVRDASVVREVLHLGVVDYLVKPFAPERLQLTLGAFVARVRTLRRNHLTQDEVDRIHASGATRLSRLPKGLKRSTLVAVRRALDAAEGPLAAVEVAKVAGVARVTARRYLEYLEVTGAVEIEQERSGPGRPRNRYRYAQQPRLASD